MRPNSASPAGLATGFVDASFETVWDDEERKTPDSRLRSASRLFIRTIAVLLLQFPKLDCQADAERTFTA